MMVMKPLTIEYDSERKSPPTDYSYENEYQPQPCRSYGQAMREIILFEVGYAWRFILSPQKLPGFGMWKDRTETDEDLLTELGGNWREFPIES